MEDEITLLPVRDEDLATVHRLISDPSATGSFEWYGWLDPNVLRRRWADNALLAEDGGVLMVAAGADRLGFVSWRKVPTARGSYCWSIGIGILPEARGRGHGTRAQRLMVRYLFAHTQVNRIQADTEIDNLAEQRALEKAGFSREAVLRGYGFQGGRWHDGALYSILRSEVDLAEPC